jgi:hypothetical protein
MPADLDETIANRDKAVQENQRLIYSVRLECLEAMSNALRDYGVVPTHFGGCCLVGADVQRLTGNLDKRS